MAEEGTGDSQNEIVFDDIPSATPTARIKESKSRRGWDIDKRRKADPPPPGVTDQVQANLTAMAEAIKQLSEEVIAARQEANLAAVKAETVGRDAVEMAQKTVVAGLQQVNESMDKAIDARAQAIGNLIIERISQGAPQAQSPQPQVDTAAAQGNGQTQARQAPNMFELILANALQREMGGGAANNPFAQLTQAAQSMGQFYTALMEPLSRMQQDVRRTTLQELIALDRTGGSLPWHDSAPKPADTPKANLNQAAADILAGKCHVR